MDIALILSRIRPNAQWGSAATYADLQRTWRDQSQAIPTQAELDTEWAAILAEQAPAAVAAATIAATKADYDTTDRNAVLLRAVVATLLDEINVLRAWIAAFKVETAAASSLADLKTRVAGLPAMPARTPTQARTAIFSKVDG